jgi:CheY-like chemotaxis protein
MPGKTILVIDPDTISRNFVANALRQAGYKVTTASSAKEGLISAWRDLPDLIVIEPVLPDMAGEELAGKLRHDPRSGHVPLLALSIDGRPTRLKSCLVAGFDEFIVKAGQIIPALLESVERLLSSAAEEPAPLAARSGLSIIFTSAKGGIGTSSICANLAMNIGQSHPDALVSLADMVLPIGSIASIRSRARPTCFASISRWLNPGTFICSRVPPIRKAPAISRWSASAPLWTS